ncbi:MAG: hypothetical protein KGJ80_15060 [Chloroflexota bacterium]|nr:hypothetical protein [Chloroflexota bacterium]
MRNIKILVLISTLVFASDVGPLHPYMAVIAIASTILFGVTSFMMYQKASGNRKVLGLTIFTALIFVAIAVITISLLITGDTKMYDAASVILLLPAIVDTILAFVLLR